MNLEIVSIEKNVVVRLKGIKNEKYNMFYGKYIEDVDDT